MAAFRTIKLDGGCRSTGTRRLFCTRNACHMCTQRFGATHSSDKYLSFLSVSNLINDGRGKSRAPLTAGSPLHSAPLRYYVFSRPIHWVCYVLSFPLDFLQLGSFWVGSIYYTRKGTCSDRPPLRHRMCARTYSVGVQVPGWQVGGVGSRDVVKKTQWNFCCAIALIDKDTALCCLNRTHRPISLRTARQAFFPSFFVLFI